MLNHLGSFLTLYYFTVYPILLSDGTWKQCVESIKNVM